MVLSMVLACSFIVVLLFSFVGFSIALFASLLLSFAFGYCFMYDAGFVFHWFSYLLSLFPWVCLAFHCFGYCVGLFFIVLSMVLIPFSLFCLLCWLAFAGCVACSLVLLFWLLFWLGYSLFGLWFWLGFPWRCLLVWLIFIGFSFLFIGFTIVFAIVVACFSLICRCNILDKQGRTPRKHHRQYGENMPNYRQHNAKARQHHRQEKENKPMP